MRRCRCGECVLPLGDRVVVGAGETRDGVRLWGEHFADHACVRWFPRSRRLYRLMADAVRTGARWDRMLYTKRAWESRVAAQASR